MTKKIVYIDMDDTIADFMRAPVFVTYGKFDVAEMFEPGFFLSLKPIEGALVAVRQIIRMGYDVQILSQPVAESAHSYSEKVQWIGQHFPELIGKINLTQDKGLFKGDYLIDDNEPKWKAKFEANGGKFLTFDHHNPKTSWILIVDKLKQEMENAGKEASEA